MTKIDLIIVCVIVATCITSAGVLGYFAGWNRSETEIKMKPYEMFMRERKPWSGWAEWPFVRHRDLKQNQIARELERLDPNITQRQYAKLQRRFSGLCCVQCVCCARSSDLNFVEARQWWICRDCAAKHGYSKCQICRGIYDLIHAPLWDAYVCAACDARFGELLKQPRYKHAK